MLDKNLAALWLRDVQRERNPAFALIVMRRMEQAQFRRSIARTVAGIATGALLLAICAPVLIPICEQTFGHSISAPVMALFLMALSFVLSRIAEISHG